MAINEGDLREEDKRGGEHLEEDLNFIFGLRISEGGGGGNWKNCFWVTLTGHWCCLEFCARGPGNHKDSWRYGAREAVPSWLGG